MGTTATTIHLSADAPATCTASGKSLTVDLPESEGGTGAGFNGGDLLLAAVAGCYANDLRRLADRDGLELTGCRVVAEADWGGDPVTALAIRCRLECDDERVLALREELSANAAIPLALAKGMTVPLD